MSLRPTLLSEITLNNAKGLDKNVIPSVFGGQIKVGTWENTLYGFAIFQVACLLINWWYYPGLKAEFKRP